MATTVTVPGNYTYAGVEHVARIKAALRDPLTGVLGKYRDCGAPESIKIDHQISKVTDKNTMTLAGGDLYAASNIDGATVQIDLKDWSPANFAMVLASKRVDKPEVAVTAELREVEAGEYVTWHRPVKFTLVEKEDGATFAPAVLGVDYILGDTGVTALVDATLRFTGKLLSVYNLQALTTVGAEFDFILEFRNKRDGGKRKVYHLRRVVVDPASGTDLLAEGAKLPLTGTLLADLNVGEGESPFYSVDGEL